MRRRDLVLGGAFGLAAAAAKGALAQPAAKTTHTAHYYGQIMQIMFTTSTDLTPFMPPGLTPLDPHAASSRLSG